jgi:hypothetical protein
MVLTLKYFMTPMANRNRVFQCIEPSEAVVLGRIIYLKIF